MIQLALYKGGTKYDFLVKVRTLSDYTHVAFAMGNIKIESMPFIGVRKAPVTQFPGKCKIDLFDIKGMTKEKGDRIWAWAESQIGKKYDFWGVFGYAIRFGKLEEPDKWFCSELCEYGLRLEGFNTTPDRPHYRVSPAWQAKSNLLIPAGSIWT